MVGDTSRTPDLERVAEIFERLRGVPPDRRRETLDEACAGDDRIRAEVESMLRAERAAGEFLAAPTAGQHAAASASVREGPGAMVGRYKLLQQIGEGGFGVVFMAEQVEPVTRRVAVKIVKPGMDSAQVLARFEAERQALALMDHPCIARVFDAGETEHARPYFVMELVEGVPITEYCDEASLSVRERLSLFLQVCGAVQHAHQKGIIHRDLKPTNILVTRRDGEPAPKVIDFGIAKALRDRLTDRTLFTAYGHFIGTPEYMSPEQAELSEAGVDTRSDIYSLGVLLYELLTGVTPIDAKALRSAAFAEMQRLIVEGDTPRPSQKVMRLEALDTVSARRRIEPTRLGSLLRGDLDWVILKALEKDRARRYPTASGLADDVERFLKDEPVAARPPSVLYRARKFVKRRRAAATLIAVVALGLVLGVGGLGGGMAWALSERDRATRENDRAEEVKRLLIEMLGSVDPAIARTQDTTLLRRLLENAVDRLDRGEVDDPLVEAEIRGVIGHTFRTVGALDDAERQFDAAMDLCRSAAAGGDLLTLRTQNELAWVYREAGRLDESESMTRAALEAAQSQLGPTHEVTITARNNLAILHGLRGNPERAIELISKLRDDLVIALGPDHPRTMSCDHNIAVGYQNLGDLEQAESIIADVLERRRRVIGDDHPYTITSIMVYGNILRARGRLGEAEALFVEAVELHESVYGSDHFLTAGARSNLGNILSERGLYKDAVRILEESAEAVGAELGPDHHLALVLRHDFASALQQVGRHEEAIEVATDVVERRTRLLGPAMPLTLSTRALLGGAYVSLGQFADAERELAEVLERLRARLGDKHPWTLETKLLLAEVYDATDRKAAGEDLYRQVLSETLAAAEAPQASPEQLIKAANLLIDAPTQDLLNPERALALAERAIRLCENRDPVVRLVRALRSAARAHLAQGDVEAAAAAANRALHQFPVGGPERLRAELEALAAE